MRRGRVRKMGHLFRLGGGHLARKPDGHLANEDITWGCDGSQLAACYKINGYSDGDLTACAACDNSGDPAWDGSVEITSAPPYDCSDPVTWDIEASKSINGKAIWGESRLVWMAGPCEWWFQIICAGGGLPYVWFGKKASGDTPAGIYTRDSGCDVTATLTVVEC